MRTTFKQVLSIIFEWLNNNINWLFSGLGLVIVPGILTLLKGPKNSATIIQSSICVLDKGSPSIWENFVGSYRAFNAPWKVEFNSANLSRFVDIHKKRYENRWCPLRVLLDLKASHSLMKCRVLRHKSQANKICCYYKLFCSDNTQQGDHRILKRLKT